LQVPDYAQGVLALTDRRGWGDHEAAVSARMERQKALLESGRQAEFVLTEAAVRLRVASQQVMAGQLARLRELAVAGGNLTVAVIPAGVQATAVPWCAFHLYEGLPGGELPFAAIELPHGRLTVSDPADVTVYQEQLALLRAAALTGEAAAALLDGIAFPL
jgi:hypothetical protein